MKTKQTNPSECSITELFGDAIYTYTRKQAIEDGFLCDVSSMAKEAGLIVPVAVTSAVWDQYIEWTETDTKRQTMQDTDGRLWDVLYMLRLAIQSSKSDTVLYEVFIVPRGGKARKPKSTLLKAMIGGGDNGEPVMTIMLPNED